MKNMATEKAVTVVDLRTGAEYVYTLRPAYAVMTAFLQHEKGDWNTADYGPKFDKMVRDLVIGAKTVAYGDYCAKIAD